LAGLAVLMGVTAGADSAEFEAAAGALDKNSVQLSEAVGSVYGDAGAKKFLSLWRAHIGFFVDYTLAKAGGDQAGIKDAKNKLDGYRNDFGAFIEGATEGGLPADAVADALEPHVTSTIAAIDSVIAGDGKAFDRLRVAASHLPGIATALSGAIVAQFPEMF
ncbi:MAG: copper amine oxidase, partial [Actinomycetota bacterium]